MRIATSCIALSALALATAATAGDTLLWDNDIDSDGFNARAISPPLFPDIRVADDVLVPETSWLVSEVRVTGVEDDGWAPGTLANVTFYSDDGGVPGSVVAEYEGAFTRTPTGNQLFDRDEYTYFIEFDKALLIDEGPKWVGARFPEGGGDGTNYWTTSTGGDHADTPSQFSLDAGVTWADSGAGWDQTFEIYGGLPEGAPRDAHGLRHFPDGDASLSVNENGDLVISNIGSSGDDGTSTVLGPSGEGYSGSMTVAAFPNGASAAVNLIGTVDGNADTPLTSTTMISDGTDVSIKPIVPGTYTLNLYNAGGDPIYTESGIDPEDDKVSVPVGALASFTATSEMAMPTTVELVAGINTPSPVTVNVAGEGDFQADRIEMVPDGGIAGLEAVTSVALRFADTGDVGVFNETLRKFVLDNTVVGDTKFSAEAEGLVLSNIGSIGDGLSQALPNVVTLDATFAPISFSGPGARFVMVSSNGGTQSEVGSVGLWNVGLVGVPASYAGAGATEVEVQIYLGGELQDSYVTPNSPLRVANILPAPDDTQPELIAAGLLDSPGTYLVFDRVGVVADSVGNPVADGDEVRIIAVLPGGVAPLTQLELDLRNLPATTITDLVYTTGEEPKCTPAPDGDTNFDGCTDFDDILAVLSGWNGEGEGDADCSGVIDFDDLLLVLSGWSAKGECN